MARISLGRARPECTSCAIRRVSTAVLPDPAPARISSGPEPCRTASRWGSLSPSSRSDGRVLLGGNGHLRHLRSSIGMHWDASAMSELPDASAPSAPGSPRAPGPLSIDFDRLPTVAPGPPPTLDPERHFLEGTREDVAAYLLTLGHDQLRLRLVPDTAQAAGVFGLLHDRVGADGSLPSRRFLEPGGATGARRRRPGRRPRTGPRARARRPLRPSTARARRLPR